MLADANEEKSVISMADATLSPDTATVVQILEHLPNAERKIVVERVHDLIEEWSDEPDGFLILSSSHFTINLDFTYQYEIFAHRQIQETL